MNSVRKGIVAVLLVLLLLLACGCDAPSPPDTSTPTTTVPTATPTTSPAQNTPPPSTQLTADRIPNTADWKTAGLESAGIGGAAVLHTEQDGEYTYHLLGYSGERTGWPYICFLALETTDTVFLEALYDYLLYVDGEDPRMGMYDFDGKPGKELYFHPETSANGGYGGQLSLVYKGTDAGLVKMFDSETFDNGYYSKLEAPFKLVITNRFTGFRTEIDCSEDEVRRTAFDEDGQPRKDSFDFYYGCMLFDTYYEFIPTKWWSDEPYTLSCKQYTSFYSHTDHVGDTAFMIAYDNETEQFVVTQAGFITYAEK